MLSQDIKQRPEDWLINELLGIYFVPTNIKLSSGRAKLFMLEDNEAVIKMTIKMRSPQMKHISRTHRICIDSLFEIIDQDPGCFIRYVGTKLQISDILTKGMFTADQFSKLSQMCGRLFSQNHFDSAYRRRPFVCDGARVDNAAEEEPQDCRRIRRCRQ